MPKPRTSLIPTDAQVKAALAALAAVERLTAELKAGPQKTLMCLEKWRDYGAVLLAKRVLMPSNMKFGQWVEEHGLDAGLAAHTVTRSNAMWLAERWNDVLENLQNVSDHHPNHARQQCRDAGHEWAGETEHEKERKEQSERTRGRRGHRF